MTTIAGETESSPRLRFSHPLYVAATLLLSFSSTTVCGHEERAGTTTGAPSKPEQWTVIFFLHVSDCAC